MQLIPFAGSGNWKREPVFIPVDKIKMLSVGKEPYEFGKKECGALYVRFMDDSHVTFYHDTFEAANAAIESIKAIFGKIQYGVIT